MNVVEIGKNILKKNGIVTNRRHLGETNVTQKEQVVTAMRKNGGYANFQQLNQTIDFTSWGTKTPQASVRRIVQTNEEFFRITSGLWGLNEAKQEILRKLDISENVKDSIENFNHGYIQGIIAEIGRIKGFDTYVPPQDKNRKFIDKRLSDVTSIQQIFEFTYSEIIRFAKTVDVIWFNKRKMPNAFYEVEHTTDMQNSLSKFYELQDFRSKFYIVAPEERKRQYEDVVSRSIYKDIKNFVGFVSYDTLIRQYEKEIISVDGAI